MIIETPFISDKTLRREYGHERVDGFYSIHEKRILSSHSITEGSRLYLVELGEVFEVDILSKEAQLGDDHQWNFWLRLAFPGTSVCYWKNAKDLGLDRLGQQAELRVLFWQKVDADQYANHVIYHRFLHEWVRQTK